MSWLRTGGVAVEGLGMLMGRSGREVGKRIMMFKAEELVGVVDMADSVRMSRWVWWTKIESSIFLARLCRIIYLHVSTLPENALKIIFVIGQMRRA